MIPDLLELESLSDGKLLIKVSGAWTINKGLPSLDLLRERLDSRENVREIAFNTDHLSDWDTLLLTFLVRIINYAGDKEISVNRDGLPNGLRNLLKLALAVPEREGARRTASSESLLYSLGNSTVSSWTAVWDTISSVGLVMRSFLRFLTGKARYRRSDFVETVCECGFRALPIVTLISMLAGLILAFVGVMQLAMFGAEIYVASLVGIAMVRVMGAVFTGIIMAGRTGASYAAQIGTMQVNEEIDALKTMGICPVEFLVMPRMIALAIMMPLLCIYADIMGIIGGMIVAVGIMDLNFYEYMGMTWEYLRLSHFWIGLFHSFVFGILIAWAGCFKGLNCGRSAASVGLATTAAVVSGIISIVVATAFITVICSMLGI
jgi:phospholipid/cholesterol/gamma-HCH transport system permease protein